MSNYAIHPSSFRDPSGFIFLKDGVLYRQVNKNFKDDFDLFVQSGCYEQLVQKKWLLPHHVVNENLAGGDDWYLTLQPEPVHFISYPYEWPFDMLKDAALLTLSILKESIRHGLILKDATPYNIQWHDYQLIFIDSLSFEKYNEADPWVAYRQFCECFLSPLLLMHYNKQPMQQLSLAWPEGIPLAVTKSLLPFRSKLSLHTYLHIHLHARIAANNKPPGEKKGVFSRKKMLNLVASLELLIQKLTLSPQQSTWSAYYDEAGQRPDYLQSKKEIIGQWLSAEKEMTTAADLGANDGAFSRLLAKNNIRTIAADFDPFCINTLYNSLKKETIINIQPVIIDLANPSPAIGVNNEEHSSFTSRLKVDLIIALALIHHLAIGKNIPFDKIAALFAGCCQKLIIEFVPKTDEKIQLMLTERKDVFNYYSQASFENYFSQHFRIKQKQEIATSGRTLYLMEKI